MHVCTVMHPRDLPPRLAQNRQKGWSGPVSRVLYPASIYLGLRSPAASSGQPGALRRRADTVCHSPPWRTTTDRPLFGLAPGGVWPAGVSPHRWCALTAPFHPCSPCGGRCVSVPLSVGSPRLGVTQRPALRSSDFPQPPLGGRGRSAHSESIVAHSHRIFGMRTAGPCFCEAATRASAIGRPAPRGCGPQPRCQETSPSRGPAPASQFFATSCGGRSPPNPNYMANSNALTMYIAIWSLVTSWSGR